MVAFDAQNYSHRTCTLVESQSKVTHSLTASPLLPTTHPCPVLATQATQQDPVNPILRSTLPVAGTDPVTPAGGQIQQALDAVIGTAVQPAPGADAAAAAVPTFPGSVVMVSLAMLLQGVWASHIRLMMPSSLDSTDLWMLQPSGTRPQGGAQKKTVSQSSSGLNPAAAAMATHWLRCLDQLDVCVLYSSPK